MLQKIPLKKLLVAFLATSVSLTAVASENDPVPAVAEQRFVFRQGGHSFAIPCDTNVDLTRRDGSIKHMIVMVHGFLRRNHYHGTILDALSHGGISTDNIAVVSPQFLTLVDVKHFGLSNDVPYWSTNGWVVGHNSRNDSELPRRARVSSFAAIDELLNQAVRNFPNLESITLAGFSAGGQFMNRYAAGNQAHDGIARRGIEISYIVSAPSSYLYFNELRPVSLEPLEFGPISETEYADCAGYNTYRQGLDGMNEYMNAVGPSRITTQYSQRKVTYLTGEKDDASASRYLSVSCASMVQGAHRLERAKVYHGYMKFLFGERVHDLHLLEVVPDAAHNSRQVFITDQGVKALMRGSSLSR